MKACARISSNRNGPTGTSLRLGHLRFWALSYHHEDRNPPHRLSCDCGIAILPQGPKGERAVTFMDGRRSLVYK